VRVLHLDTGRTLRGGQYQLLHLLRALPGEPMLLAPTVAPGVECAPLTVANLLRWSGRAELIHCHDAKSHTLAALFTRRPIVVARRVVFPIHAGPLSRWKYGRAAHFIAISQAVASELRRAGVPDAKVSIVPDCTEIPDSISRRTGPVVAIDSSDPGKGRALLRQTGLPIHFSSDLSQDLRDARVFVYITNSEGLGSAALLAMAYGVPVVASRVGGLPEIVIDGETGLLVANDAARIRLAVESLLADDALARRLARAGRAMVEQGFTIDRMARGTISVYRKVLA
jgi:hypothetical protein